MIIPESAVEHVDKNGNRWFFKNGILELKIYTSGNFRYYHSDENGILKSSETYRKDGSLYSKEIYDENAHELFNNKNN